VFKEGQLSGFATRTSSGAIVLLHERSDEPMRVECPNCSTTYEVPAVHFVDGTRRLRCTQCGYRWNQSASEADLNDSKKSTPLLDMLEPAMNMEASAAVNVDIVDDGDNEARTFAAELDPQSAEDAFDDIDDALAPFPVPTAEEELEAAGRRWQWGLGLVAATIIVSLMILGREAVVSAAPFTQALYRTAGLEPWSDLRRWDLCATGVDASDIRYTLTNKSAFSRSVPDLYITEAAGGLVPIDGPSGSMRAGETVRVRATNLGLEITSPATLSLSTQADQSDARAFADC
jgi:predicted Zn finger-like uncharacterized protein